MKCVGNSTFSDKKGPPFFALLLAVAAADL